MKTITVTAKDKDGNVLGTGKCQQFDTVDEAVKALGSKKVLIDVNRQVKTDCRNDLAREKSATAQLSKLAKADPKVMAEVLRLLKEAKKA